jgi:hypothetical protein
LLVTRQRERKRTPALSGTYYDLTLANKRAKKGAVQYTYVQSINAILLVAPSKCDGQRARVPAHSVCLVNSKESIGIQCFPVRDYKP